MGRRVLARTVHVTRGDNDVVTLLAGSEVPKELREFVTNERLFQDADAPAAPAPAAEREGAGDDTPGDDENGSGDGYDDLKYDELKALLKDRELPQDGKMPDMVARLREDDAEKAKEGAGDDTPGDDQNEE
jgi:hypothetical protein